jgi:alkyl sulfatase BDS1-like metallo-beta-lactamase superfamily hydrolase
LLAACLRVIGERTSAANIRNWCIARARHLDGSTPLDRLFTHRFTSQSVRSVSTSQLLSTIRVLLDPNLVPTTNLHLAFNVDGETVGLHVRNCVAVPTSGAGATSTVTLSRDSLNALLNNKAALSALVASGDVVITGETDLVVATLGAFEVDGLRS